MSGHRDRVELDIGFADEVVDSAATQDGRVIVWALTSMTKALLSVDDTLREIRDRLPEVPE